MSSGGVFGRPIVIDGRVGEDPGPSITTVVDVSSKLVAPYNGRRQFARALRVTNAGALNNLLLYVNSEAPIIVGPQDEFKLEAMVFRIAVATQHVTEQAAEADADLATAAALPAYTQAGAGVGATLTADAVGVLTVDGVATVLNDLILVKDGAADSDNGTYKCTTEGTAGVAFILTRVIDHDLEISSGDFVLVVGGTANGGTTFQITTTGAIIVDTDAILWEEMVSSYNIVATIAA